MKKLIAILAVFAVVAGAAFAKGAVDPDGTWGDVSISTRGAIGSEVNIDGVSTSTGWADGGASTTNDGDFTNYSLGLSYSWNILTVGMDFDRGGVSHYLKAGNDDISAKIKGSYTGGNQILSPTYTEFEIEASHEEEWGSIDFHYNGNFASTYDYVDYYFTDPYDHDDDAATEDIITPIPYIRSGTTPASTTKLWGSFSIYDTLFFKGAGVGADQEENRWLINDELVFPDETVSGISRGNKTKQDKDIYFLFNYDLGGVVEGLEAGLYVPTLFASSTGNRFLQTVYGLKFDGGDAVKFAFQLYGTSVTEFDPGIRFQAELLGLVGFDVIVENFDSDPISLWLGAKISSPDVELGADAKLTASAKFYTLNNFDTFNLEADLGLGYNAEPLGAQVDFEFRSEFGETILPDEYVASIEIKPSVWYDIDPDHLRAKVGATFKIPFNDNKDIEWSLGPELIYNFYGGGFGDFHKKFDDTGVKTGMYLGYAVGGTLGDNGGITSNKVTLGMKWNF